MSERPVYITPNGCKSHRRWRNKAEAKQAIRRRQKVYGGRVMRAFRCEWCDGWHIGHMPPKDQLRDQRSVHKG